MNQFKTTCLWDFLVWIAHHHVALVQQVNFRSWNCQSVPLKSTENKTAVARNLGGIYTRTIMRKTFLKTFTLFIVSQHLYWFISYARNRLNEYGNTGRVWFMRDKEKITCQIQLCRFRTVFAVYMRKTNCAKWYCFRSTHFCNWIRSCCFHFAFSSN